MTDLSIRERVAVEVMGRVGPQQHETQYCEDDYYSFCVNCGMDNSCWPRGAPRPLDCHDCVGHPAYDEDIAAAWQVVEKMREKGFDFEIGADNASRWNAHFSMAHDGVTCMDCEADAEEAALAICLAALEAVKP